MPIILSIETSAQKVVKKSRPIIIDQNFRSCAELMSTISSYGKEVSDLNKKYSKTGSDVVAFIYVEGDEDRKQILEIETHIEDMCE
jgi:hypothetical protein